MNNLNSFEQGMMAATIVVGFVILILLVFVFAIQLFYCIGLYKMGKRAGVRNSWLAFIFPFDVYVMGKLIGPNRVRMFGRNVDDPGKALVLTMLGMIVASIMTSMLVTYGGVIGAILGLFLGFATLLGTIFVYICRYKFLTKYKGETGAVLFLISVVFNIAWPFIVFSLRNLDPIDDESDYSSHDDYNSYGGYYNNNYYEG